MSQSITIASVRVASAVTASISTASIASPAVELPARSLPRIDGDTDGHAFSAAMSSAAARADRGGITSHRANNHGANSHGLSSHDASGNGLDNLSAIAGLQRASKVFEHVGRLQKDYGQTMEQHKNLAIRTSQLGQGVARIDAEIQKLTEQQKDADTGRQSALDRRKVLEQRIARAGREITEARQHVQALNGRLEAATLKRKSVDDRIGALQTKKAQIGALMPLFDQHRQASAKLLGDMSAAMRIPVPAAVIRISPQLHPAEAVRVDDDTTSSAPLAHSLPISTPAAKTSAPPNIT